MNHPKVLFTIPTYKQVDSLCFAGHMANLMESVQTGFMCGMSIEAGAYITTTRNRYCKTALEMHARGECTHLWMIDDDMAIPSGAMVKLLSRAVPVVGAAYYTREPKPVAYNLEPFSLLDDIPLSGTIRVEGTGAGCLLISCETLLAMREFTGNECWFFHDQSVTDANGAKVPQGEDVSFFRTLRKMGVPTIIDCDVQCGHAGTAFIDRSVFDLHRKLNAEKDKPCSA